MNPNLLPPTNFAYLQAHDEQLVRLGLLAERYFADDPNTCLLKLRQFAELLARLLAARTGLYTTAQESQADLLYRLRAEGLLPPDVARLFDEIRRSGNTANHALQGDHRTALTMLKVSWQIGIWYHRTFADPKFKSGPFVPPTAPVAQATDEREELRTELTRLQSALEQYQATQQATAAQLAATTAQLQTAQEEQRFWEELAVATEEAKTALAAKLAAQQAVATAQPTQFVNAVVRAANQAAAGVELDEAATRQLIDQQLRQAGWEVDSVNLRQNKGARPEKGKNRAIAEWTTMDGRADYLLFIGLTPVAAVEAKRKNTDVAAALQQAKRYSRGFNPPSEVAAAGGPWDKFRLPFAFATNGRPFLRQLQEQSGIWFCDLRRPDNLSRPLDGWYSPAGLLALLQQDEAGANAQLAVEPFHYGFALRPYQIAAIQAVEAAIIAGRRELLLAMATGTGKTKTCIALIYRLLKTQRFRRVLFLVDRAALGEQAANAFKDTRMESLQTFADIFGIKELDQAAPETATAVHIATIQGMVQRVLNPSDDQPPPAVDQYDCIIVDECHRGYLLDRELADSELLFRGYDDYISKYRRVIDYFDAVKVGLTATPALHTSEIFGAPIYSYGYRAAVIDGWLVDYEPPFVIDTKLNTEGIHWQAGETVKQYDPHQNRIDLFTTPDAIDLEIDSFNRKVITESFNRVVCAALAREIDPYEPRKTLIFCVNSDHADLVVRLLKEAFAAQYGAVDDDAVIKITGNADQPLQLIRRFKNERNPTVAVTVDLLTTGIDVPAICNLVFLRRVNSRILFDQMMGRATRLCDELGKETFRVFDAVQLFSAIQGVTEMQPVVVNPKIPFAQLARELTYITDAAHHALARDQFVAKLQRKSARFDETAAADFERAAGLPAPEFIAALRTMPPAAIAQWFLDHATVGEVLDQISGGGRAPLLISEHPDELYQVTRGYGKGEKPADYLQAFTDFIRTKQDEIPALVTVLTRPRDLTRKDLRDLLWALDQAGFSEANLTTAWRELTNQEIAARIVGYIRKAAIDDPLLPYAQRVDGALQTILAAQNWSTPQRQWLQRIAAQTKANGIVDRAALDDPDQIFRREGGGFPRLDRLFDGQLQSVLETFNETIWRRAA